MDEMIKKLDDVLESERLLTARMVDSVLRSTQIASTATPEMQDMFQHWLFLIGEQVLREIEASGECNVPELSRTIGVGETTLFSLLVFLHRSGKLRVEKVYFSAGTDKNSEACDCLMKK